MSTETRIKQVTSAVPYEAVVCDGCGTEADCGKRHRPEGWAIYNGDVDLCMECATAIDAAVQKLREQNNAAQGAQV